MLEASTMKKCQINASMGQPQSWKISLSANFRGLSAKFYCRSGQSWFPFFKKTAACDVSLRVKVRQIFIKIKVAASQPVWKGRFRTLKLNTLLRWKKVSVVKLRGERSFLTEKQTDKPSSSSLSNDRASFYPCFTPNTHWAKDIARGWASYWKEQLTSLAKSLSLSSNLVSRRKNESSVIQGVEVATTVVLLLQLATAGAVRLPVLLHTAGACVVGFFVNIFRYNKYISADRYKLWQAILGITALCQMVWSTFEKYSPTSIMPGIIVATIELLLIVLARLDRVQESLAKRKGGIFSWAAKVLFMSSRLSQLFCNFLNQTNIKGLFISTILLAFLGNGLLISCTSYIRNSTWFTGAFWDYLVKI